MIVKSALVFLKFVDVLWDTYEGVVGALNSRKVISKPVIDSAKPSYSVVNK